MSITYSITAIDGRLNGLVSAIGSSARMLLRAGSTTISTIPLSTPCGTVSSGVLTFFTGVDLGASATGFVNNAVITTNAGVTMISGMTAGIPLSGSEVIISNGLNSTLISSGQTVAFLSAQIVGS